MATSIAAAGLDDQQKKWQEVGDLSKGYLQAPGNPATMFGRCWRRERVCFRRVYGQKPCFMLLEEQNRGFMQFVAPKHCLIKPGSGFRA